MSHNALGVQKQSLQTFPQIVERFFILLPQFLVKYLIANFRKKDYNFNREIDSSFAEHNSRDQP